MIPTAENLSTGRETCPHMDCWKNGSDKERKGIVTREIFCGNVVGLIHTQTLNMGVCYLWDMIYSYSIVSSKSFSLL